MKEWICEEVPAVTIDGKPISTMLHQTQELVRCKDCKWLKWIDVDDEVVYCKMHETSHDMNWFCADGEMRNDGR